MRVMQTSEENLPKTLKARLIGFVRRRPLLTITLLLSFLLLIYLLYLDWVVRERFEGQRWLVPSRVYARSLELEPGMPLTSEQLAEELTMAGYRSSKDGRAPGSFARSASVLNVTTRPFRFWDGKQDSVQAQVRFSGGKISSVVVQGSGKPLETLRLEPLLIGSIYPSHHEDRLLLKLGDMPSTLLAGLQAVEDRSFSSHIGVDFRGVARALFVNVRSGHVVQGGSTLTQQLIKNFYLGSERTIWRKINEVLMAFMLERHYEKREILEAYANEIYLAQDGSRAIHGFGLASEYYFDKPIKSLAVQEQALLVGILRGPSYYDPRRHPKRATERRNQVLDIMYKDGLITEQQAKQAMAAPLGVVEKRSRSKSRFPAFMELVQRQLSTEYDESDLRGAGFSIFTTLDPLAQTAVEKSMARWTGELERQQSLPENSLQGSAVITRSGTAEVVALVGGREAGSLGFNRALDAKRPIGSLIKPVVYLTALSEPARFTLSSWLQDTPVLFPLPNGTQWEPKNYDKRVHGNVLLIKALAHSYNLSTVNLGMQVGIEKVVTNLRRLGVKSYIPQYPSLFLGAVEMTPLNVAQIYQALADSGRYQPLRAVRSVIDMEGRELKANAPEPLQVLPAESSYLTQFAMRYAAGYGTSSSVYRTLPRNINVAAKTGTTDDQRDSWFAGFGKDYVGVVWLGRDDNQPAKLSGSTGAAYVWGDIMARLKLQSLDLKPVAGVDTYAIDSATGLLSESGCNGAMSLPFIRGSQPITSAPCVLPEPEVVPEAVEGEALPSELLEQGFAPDQTQ